MKQSLRRGNQPVPGGFVISEAPCAFPLRLRRNGIPPCEKCDQERQHAGTESRLGEPFDVLPAHREQSVFLHLRGMDGLGEKQRKMWTAQSFTFQSLSRTQALCYNTYEMYQRPMHLEEGELPKWQAESDWVFMLGLPYWFIWFF